MLGESKVKKEMCGGKSCVGVREVLSVSDENESGVE